MNKRRDDQSIFKEILQERSSDTAAKDKLYRILHEASLADSMTMDTDLLKECVQTLDLLEEDTTPLSDEKMQAMQQNIESQYRTWKSAQLRHTVRKSMIRVTAACLLLFSLSSVVANAFGFNVFQIVASWGEETFDFVAQEGSGQGQNNITENYTYDSIEKAFQGIVPIPSLPSWLPDGFNFEHAERFDRASNSRVLLYYNRNESNVIIFDYVKYKEGYKAGQDSSFEKDGHSVEVYTKNSIDHYIFSNLNQTQAVWSNLNVIVNINGDISVEEMKKIIDSMYGG